MSDFDPEAIDQGAASALTHIRSDALDIVFKAISLLGDFWVLVGVVIAVSLLLVILCNFRQALLLMAVALAAWGASDGVKNIVHRQRPDLPGAVSGHDGASFPSGHALRSSAVYLFITLVAARRLKKTSLRVGLFGATLLLIVSIGFSRLYLGAHFVTDVLAGWCAGCGLAFLGIWFMGKAPQA